MKQKLYSVVCLMFLGMSFSFGQHYVNVYQDANEDVRFKMDANKILGIDVLNDVKSTHTIGVSGLTAPHKTEFKATLNDHPKILQYTLSEDLKSLVLDTQADLYKNEIEEFLSEFNLILTGYTVTYSIND